MRIFDIEISHKTFSKITDKVVPLSSSEKCYPFVFEDAMCTPIKTESCSGQKDLYYVIGIDVDGCKDVLGFWLSEGERSRHWLQFLEELKNLAVENIVFISHDVLTGLKEAIM